MNEFTQIIKSLLDAYYEGGMQSVEDLIQSMHLSDKTLNEIEQSFTVIQRIKEKRVSLRDAKYNGYSRGEWVKEELDNIEKTNKDK